MSGGKRPHTGGRSRAGERARWIVVLGLAVGGAGCGDDAVRTNEPWPPGDEITQKRMQSNCAIVDDGVKCWASPGLQDPPSPSSHESDKEYLLLLARDEYHPGPPLPFVDLGPDAEVIALSAEPYTRCAVLQSRGVKCWGANDFFGLGLPDAERWLGDDPEERGDGMPFVDLGSNRDIIGVAYHCALFADGRVKCWGAGSARLGLGDLETRGDDPGEMGDALPYVDLGTDVRAVGLHGTPVSTCIWTAEGRVKCWGDNRDGELGIEPVGEARGDDPGEMGDALPYVDLGEDVFVVQVSVGGRHACALTDEGRIKCWGANFTRVFAPLGTMQVEHEPYQYGRLGQGDREPRVPPLGDDLPYVDLGHGARAVAVLADWSSARTCAVLDDGRVKCWGLVRGLYGDEDYEDELGDEPGEMGDGLPYVDFGGRRVEALHSGACAWLDDGSIVCPSCEILDDGSRICAVELRATREDLWDSPG